MVGAALLPGVILAGGAGRRMGGVDKAQVLLAGHALWEHVARRIAPQVDALAVNAPGGTWVIGGAPLPCLPDPVPDRPGPLAGLLAALIWAEERDAEHVLTVATDTPFLPADLVTRLGKSPAIAASAGRTHPVVGLWPVSCQPELRAALDAGDRRIGHFAARIGARQVAWEDEGDPFFNVNTPSDLKIAEQRLTASLR